MIRRRRRGDRAPSRPSRSEAPSCLPRRRLLRFPIPPLRRNRGPPMAHNFHGTLQELRTASGKTGRFYSLPALEKAGVGRVSRLPVSIRIVLESVLRNCDGKKITDEHVRQLAGWSPNAPRTQEIPFVVARVV